MRFLAWFLALVMLAICLVIPLDALAGGFNSRDLCNSRGFSSRGNRGGDIVIDFGGNRGGRRGFNSRGRGFSRNSGGGEVRVFIR